MARLHRFAVHANGMDSRVSSSSTEHVPLCTVHVFFLGMLCESRLRITGCQWLIPIALAFAVLILLRLYL